VAESSPRRPRRIRNILLFTLGVAVALSAAIWLTARPRLEHWLRTSVIATLEQRLDSHVELQRISIELGPVTRISGGPLTIRHRSRLDVAPLVHLDRFETTMTWREVLRRPRRVDTVILTGLAITIPPSAGEGQPRFPSADKITRDSSAKAVVDVVAPDVASEPVPPPASDAAHRGSPPPGTSENGAMPNAGNAAMTDKAPAVIIGRITADAATLTILPRDIRKLPRRFVMHRLTMRDITTTLPMSFETVLENPQPRGRIETRGTFGPWNVAAPARTPLQADYRFIDADLSTIKGIAGICSRLARTAVYSNG